MLSLFVYPTLLFWRVIKTRLFTRIGEQSVLFNHNFEVTTLAMMHSYFFNGSLSTVRRDGGQIISPQYYVIILTA